MSAYLNGEGVQEFFTGVNERFNEDRTIFKPYKHKLIWNNLTIK